MSGGAGPPHDRGYEAPGRAGPASSPLVTGGRCRASRRPPSDLLTVENTKVRHPTWREARPEAKKTRRRFATRLEAPARAPVTSDQQETRSPSPLSFSSLLERGASSPSSAHHHHRRCAGFARTSPWWESDHTGEKKEAAPIPFGAASPHLVAAAKEPVACPQRPSLVAAGSGDEGRSAFASQRPAALWAGPAGAGCCPIVAEGQVCGHRAQGMRRKRKSSASSHCARMASLSFAGERP